MSLRIEDWGELSYLDAHKKQLDYVEKRVAGELEDTLVFCRHNPPLITLGRGNKRHPVQLAVDNPFEVVEVERGGLATYHGPGQIVIYPIVKMGAAPCLFGGVVDLIRFLEKWIVDFLRTYKVEAMAREGHTGVWVSEEHKIASIGIASRHWVSYHGAAINLSTGSAPWQAFNPCGYSSAVMTDLQKESKILVSYIDALESLTNTLNVRMK